MNKMIKTYVSPSLLILEAEIDCSDAQVSINQGLIDNFERDNDEIEGF